MWKQRVWVVGGRGQGAEGGIEGEYVTIAISKFGQGSEAFLDEKGV